MFAQLAKLEISRTDPDDLPSSYLLQAHLASLLDGVEAGHIASDTAKLFRRKFAAELRRVGYIGPGLKLTGVPLQAQVVWNAFLDAVRLTGEARHTKLKRPHKLADSRKPTSGYASTELVTLGELSWHAALVQLGVKLDPSYGDLDGIVEEDIKLNGHDRRFLARCVHCLSIALSSGAVPVRTLLKDSSRAVVWLAPHADRVQALIDSRTSLGLNQATADDLRDLLGLWAQDGVRPRPLAVFKIAPGKQLYAPNAITANGYPRFRHRPKRLMASGPHVGLTYNLNRRLASAWPGSAEVVAIGVKMNEVVEIIAAGTPKRLPSSHRQILAAHREYSRHVSGRRSWLGILRKLDTLVK